MGVSMRAWLLVTCLGMPALFSCHEFSETLCRKTEYFDNGKCYPLPDGAVHCGDCSGPTPICDQTSGKCVACIDNSSCTELDKSVCDLSSHTCTACTDNSGCSHLAGRGVCNGGSCVECTSETEESACNGHTCDSSTNTCTSVLRYSIDVCRPCGGDSECKGNQSATHYCVPMVFSPAGVSQPVGSYCLASVPNTGCTKPYGSGITRTTVSGKTGLSFCGPVETATTCPAVLALTAPDPAKPNCTAASECGLPDINDGLCEQTVTSGVSKICTYTCGSTDECPGSKPCPLGGGYCGQP